MQHNPFTISRERLYFAFSHFNVRFILYMRLIAFATVYFFTSPKLSDFKWKILFLSVSFSLSLSLDCIVCHPTLHECMFIIQIIFDFKYRIFCLDHVLYRILRGTPSIGHLRWCHHNLALEYHVDDRNYLVAVIWAAFHCDVMPIFVFEAIVVHV